jgi:FKBP-type peptidyl-prolyl cis-trans isomerase SlpA
MSENLDVSIDKKITEKSDVIMHLDIRLKDGSIAESSRKMEKPLSFKMGEGVFSDKFESEILGLKAGAKKKVMLMPEDAFGQPHPANIFQVPKDKFAGFSEPLEVGLIIEFSQINGVPQLGIIREIEDDEIKVDFNHPLSGQVVLFDFEILGVK